MTRREARAIERSVVASVRRTTRADVAKRRQASAPHGHSATKRVVAAVVGGAAVLGIVAASVLPVLGSQEPAQASQDQALSAYASASDEAQVFAATEKGGTLGALATVTYSAELRTPTPTPTPTQEAEVAAVSGETTDDATATDDSSSDALPAPYAPVQYTGGGAPSDWMAAAGIAESDWGYVDYIVSQESGWNPNATNASSGACGLVQALPCSKVAGGGYDPVANLQWGNGYAVGRYGSWAAAYAFWTSNHWW